MFRFLFRLIGLWMLAGAFVALVIDGTRSITAGRLVILPLVDAWTAIHPAGAEWFRTIALEQSPRVQSVLGYVLDAPLWTVLGVLGALLVFLGRRRARLIGYSSRD